MLTVREKSFFASFAEFELRPAHSSIQEFYRLADLKDWQRETDIFRIFWRACFGTEALSQADAESRGCDDVQIPSLPLLEKRLQSSDTESGANPVSESYPLQLGLVRDGTAQVPEYSDDSLLLLTSHLEQLNLENAKVAGVESSSQQLERDQTTCTTRRAPSESIDDGVIIRYFDTFSGFEPDNGSLLKVEFDRLAAQQQWKAGSIVYKNQFIRCCTNEFIFFCGDNNSQLEAWQNLVVDITGMVPSPGSKNKCRKALQGCYVNIFDYVDSKRQNRDVEPVFTTRSSFRKHTFKKAYVFPKSAAKTNPFLSIMLERLFGFG